MMNASARSLLLSLLGLPKADLALPKAILAKKLNLTAHYFDKLIAKLIACGVMERISAPFGKPSTLVVKCDFGGTGRVHEPYESSNRAQSLQGPMNPQATIPGSKESCRPGTSKSPVQIALKTPSCISPPGLLDPEDPAIVFSLRSKTRHASPAAQVAHALTSDSLKAETTLKVGKREMSAAQIRAEAFAGKLDEKSSTYLFNLKRVPKRAWAYTAFLNGLGDRIKAQWAARVGHKKIAANSTDGERWRKIAATVVSLQVTPEHFLEVAFDICPKRFAYPTTTFLVSDYLKTAIDAWLPKEQRDNLEAIDPEIMVRSQKMVEEARANNPTPLPRKMPLTGNWPGLYGRQNNKREFTEQPMTDEDKDG